jgi:hypothetical protein
MLLIAAGKAPKEIGRRAFSQRQDRGHIPHSDSVFIVEDSLKIRKELANLVADEKDFAVVGEAGSVR